MKPPPCKFTDIQRKIDAALDFDNDIDLAIDALRQFEKVWEYWSRQDSLRREVFKSNAKPWLKRVCLAQDRQWKSARLVEGQEYTKSAVFLLSCEYGYNYMMAGAMYRLISLSSGLPGAKELIDFLDEREKQGLPHIRHLNLRPMGSPHEEIYRYRENNTEWPYNWVYANHYPELLRHMLDNNSCILDTALARLPKKVKDFFGHSGGFLAEQLDGFDRRKLDRPIVLRPESISISPSFENAVNVPGQLIAILKAVPPRHVAHEHVQDALENIEAVRDDQLERQARILEAAQKREEMLRSIWSSKP